MDKAELKALIENAKDVQIKKVNVPEWGCDVYVKTMDGLQLKQFASLAQAKDQRLYLLAFTLCDESGELLYSVDEIETLFKKSLTALLRVAVAAENLNKLTEEELEVTEKN